MENRNFSQLLKARHELGLSVCVGLDSEYKKIPDCVRNAEVGFSRESLLLPFNKAIIDATKDLVCAYKPNVAFYESLSDGYGWPALSRTIDYINTVAPDVPVILDAKRADIGNTNLGYVKAAFEHFKADAITVHPYLGAEALAPFLDNPDKGVFVLCRTSNPGAGELQDRRIIVDDEELLGNIDQYRDSCDRLDYFGIQGPYVMPQYLYLAYRVAKHWNKNGNCGLVVGATYPGELRKVRDLVGDDMSILIPGIGAQGGDLEATVQAGQGESGKGICLINSSRGIIFASPGEDFAEAARAETEKLHNAINQQRKG